MEIIPAIDIKQGRCVRLFQGDYAREIVYSPDPAEVARLWHSQGARRLHVVDLDGAARGEPQNLEAIQAILKAVPLPLQLGGGLRRREIVERFFSWGIDRVVLGTAAVEEPLLVEELCLTYPERIVVSIDARDGWVASHGWKRRAAITAAGLARRMARLGAQRLVYTDIGRDGTLTSPNFAAIAELVSQSPIPIIASGGVASLSHLERLAELGVEAAIVGKALYTDDLKLPQAISFLQEVTPRAPQI